MRYSNRSTHNLAHLAARDAVDCLARAVDEEVGGKFACQLCGALFKDPIVLPCGHSMCFACTERVKRPLVRQVDGGAQSPNCQHP
jgi:hypothetical protein